jgi:hypothetical protein
MGEGDRIAKDTERFLDVSYVYLLYRLRVDFVLALLKLFKQKIIRIDKTFSAGKIGFFK